MQDTLPIFDSGLRYSSDLWMTSARIVESAKMPQDLIRTEEALLARAKRNAPDPTIFDEHKPLFLPLRISNNGLDAYFTRMAPSSLKNYAKHAAEGRSFQDSHAVNKLGLGYSLTGDYREEGEEYAATYAYVYVTPGITDIDAFIHRYRSGSVRDISIGFYGGTFRCSICNENMWGAPYRCPHWPGVEYEIEDRNDRGDVLSTRTELAFAWVEDAVLSEISAVYDGATPGAVILKAERQIAEGRMPVQVVRMLNQRYRGLNLPLPESRIIAPGVSLDTRGAVMPSNDHLKSNSPAPADAASTERSPAATGLHESEAAAAGDRSVLADIRTVLAGFIPEGQTVLDGVRALLAKYEESRAMAEIGSRYRAKLIDGAIAEGVRAYGNDFDADGRRTLLEKLDIGDIEAMGAEWKRAADAVFPVGRQTREESGREEPTGGRIPAAAFQV